MALEHFCHVPGCGVKVPPKLLMCGRHWARVPEDIKKLVWSNYRSGQEIDKNPSPEYLQAAKLAIASVKESMKNEENSSKAKVGRSVFEEIEERFECCEVFGCKTPRPEKGLLMCRKHWSQVPEDIKKLVWANYRLDKNPSSEYLQAAKLAIASVKEIK